MTRSASRFGAAHPDPVTPSDGVQDFAGGIATTGPITAGGILTNSGGIVRNHKNVDVNSGNYIVLETDDLLFIQDSGGSGNSAVLPDVPTDSTTYGFHNEGTTNNVTIVTAGDDKIEGVDSVDIGPDGTVHLTYDASETDWVSH